MPTLSPSGTSVSITDIFVGKSIASSGLHVEAAYGRTDEIPALIVSRDFCLVTDSTVLSSGYGEYHVGDVEANETDSEDASYAVGLQYGGHGPEKSRGTYKRDEIHKTNCPPSGRSRYALHCRIFLLK